MSAPIHARSLLITLALIGCNPGGSGSRPEAAPPISRRAVPPSPKWKAVDDLIGQQKLAEAVAEAGKIRLAAQDAGQQQEWTRALIREVQLRIALSGYETAVRFLKDQPWPRDAVERLILHLYYARTLVTYLQAYSWEINQREKVDSHGTVDLKAWTRDQIFGEAQKAYAQVWMHRVELSQAKLDTLAEYLTPNNYPQQVRGTLRDAVSYLAVEVLADSSFWRPEESGDLFRLDFSALLHGDPAHSHTVHLDDPAVHPLLKALAVLDDLETWHTQQKHPEAALEARLERLRRLHNAFSEKADRDAIRQHLEKLLLTYRPLPWWAMGQALLAQLWRDDEQDLVRAHSLALQGHKAYPDSPGAKACLNLYRSIEAPDYQLATMEADAPDRRSIAITHKNLPALHFRAYAADLVKRVESARDYDLLYGYKDLPGFLSSGKPAAEWTEKLPKTPDYREHRTFVVPPLHARGLYVIFASVRPDFKEGQNRILAANLILGDLVLVSRYDNGGVEVTVISSESGQPVPDAGVALYRYDWNNRHERVAEKRTDSGGRARFDGGHDDARSHFLLCRKGDDVALDKSSLYLQKESPPQPALASLVYTDRSVYRPLQKLSWKVIAYQGQSAEGRFQVTPNATLTVGLYDPNSQQVLKQEVKTSAYGSAAGEFTVPAGRLLGQWTVRSSWNGSQGVRVEEYKRPTFEVSLKDPEQALRLNRPATLTGEAHYYFGLPVSAGSVRWRISREPVYPWWWGYYGFASAAGTQTVATGNAALQPDGTFHIQFTPQADERGGKDLSYRYAVAADLTDEGGETRSAGRGFRLGLVSVEATLTADTGFFRAGQKDPALLTVRLTSLDGVPRAGAGSFRVVALKQPAHAVLPADQPLPEPPAAQDKTGPSQNKPFRTPGDTQRLRWQTDYVPEGVIATWTDGEEKARGPLQHDARGEARISLPPLPPGAYRVRYETQDDFASTYQTWKDIIVAGPQTDLALPGLLLCENPTVKVGGTARFLALTGLADQPLFFDIFRNGKLSERRKLLQGTLVEVPVSEADRGGFGVMLWALRDHQYMSFQQSVLVPWDNKQLQVSFATFRDKIRPGARETWRITVKDPKGAQAEAGAAEILAYMYDRSLDVFQAHVPPSPLSLFPYRGSVPWSRASLGPAPVQWVVSQDIAGVPPGPALHGDALLFYDRYGIGGVGHRYRALSLAQPMPSAAHAIRGPAKEPVSKGEAGKDSLDRMHDEERAKNDSPTTPAEKPVPGQASAQPPATQVRSNFAETAFFLPNLLTGKDGSAVIEFTVPDSVTSWNVWVHAITRDLSSAAEHRETRSVKELLVRPYLPRFFREGDQAQLKVVVNNAGDAPLSGTVAFDIIDPETQESRLALFGVTQKTQPFTVQKGQGQSVTFPVSAPTQVGTYAFKVTATAGSLSDGELRALPVLPGRYHLAQSRFVTLHDKDQRTMVFEDLKRNDDKTRIDEQLVVTLDAQLFYTVLKALPYLVTYPYECTEQTLNRFLSTGIVSSLYKDYPAIAKMAEEFARRKTQLDPFDGADPNRKMTLEESPWLETARGGRDPGAPLLNVLDPRIAGQNRDEALGKLRKAQTSLGAFPWFPGGPPSPYMTLYLMHGFARAAEFGVDVPRDMVQRGWTYLASHFRQEYASRMADQRQDCCWEFLTFLNYVASSYPDASWTAGALSDKERQQILDFSFSKWKKHSPYLKGLLALTLKRMGRPADAKLVFASVMDSARTVQDQGTFWAPEDRSWLWYNDTIETHAFALRTLLEVDPQNSKKDGLVLWLLLNKKLNQWKSTRATAEVIYSLVHYLKKEGALGVREEATVSVGPEKQTFTFEPDRYVGKAQLSIPGPKIDPAASSTVTVEKASKGTMFASATWHFSTEKLPAEDRGDFFQVSRHYFRRENNGKEFVLQPLAEGATLRPGDEVEVQISLRTQHAAEYVHLRDPRAAGLEPDTSVSRYKWDLGIAWYEETRDSGTNFFFEQLPAGEYTFKYRLRANLSGTFRIGPATIQSMYAPEFTAYTAGNLLTVAPDR